MALDTNTINSKLAANQRDLAGKAEVASAQLKAKQSSLANEATVLGQNVQQSVNGFKSLDNNITDLTNTKSVLTSISPDALVMPQSFESALNQQTLSLTGIVPPTESINIVALGGASITELTSTVTVAVERKKTLVDQINTAAAASSLEGLSSGFTENINNLKKELDSKINSSTLTQDVMGAVSAVENLGNDIANQAAVAAGSLIGAIDQTVNQVTQSISDGFESVLGGVQSSLNNLLDNVIPEVDFGTGFLQNLFEDLTGDVTSIFQNALGATTGLNSNIVSSIVKDVLNGGDINLGIATKKLIEQDESVSPRIREISKTIDNAESPEEFETRLVQRATALNVPADEITNFKERSRVIETALSQVTTTVSGKIVSEVGEFYTEDVDLAELVKRYIGGNVRSFSYISSKEELALEFVRMKRSVSELIVHASETHTNANIGAEELQLRHNEAGHIGIQYHIVIRRNGTVQRAVPLDNVVDASNINRHKFNCIDVCLIGGINVPTEDENPLLNLSASSFTQAQMKSLEAIMEVFYQKIPGGQILGHNAIDENSQDPYFDVIAFVENKFGKKSVYEDPLTDISLSASELVNKRPV
jgi:hypothetical protein